MRSARLWAQLLGLVKAVVEGVEFDAWRNRHAVAHPRLREVVAKAETIKSAKVAWRGSPRGTWTCEERDLRPYLRRPGEVIIDGPSG